MSAPQNNIVQGSARQMNAGVPPTGPKPSDIIEIRIKMPRGHYDAFSKFAQFLHSQQAQDPNTGELIFDKVTKQPVMNLPRPDVQTYLMTCGIQTYQAYLFVAEQARIRNEQLNAQKAQAQAQQQTQRG